MFVANQASKNSQITRKMFTFYHQSFHLPVAGGVAVANFPMCWLQWLVSIANNCGVAKFALLVLPEVGLVSHSAVCSATRPSSLESIEPTWHAQGIANMCHKLFKHVRRPWFLKRVAFEPGRVEIALLSSSKGRETKQYAVVSFSVWISSREI